jgi:LacI family transcriptional regulator
MQEAVRHLAQIGHRRIACLMSAGELETERRWEGYVDAMREAGLRAQASWAKRPVLAQVPPRGYVAWGREEMQDWLKDGWRKIKCTALLAQNDLAAIGVMQALQSAGIRVPEDVSVVGFDGTEVCEYFAPRLSSVTVPLREIGVCAVRTLLERIAEPTGEIQDIVLPAHFEARESSAAPKVLAKVGVLPS